MDNHALLAKRNQRLGVGAALFYNEPLQIVKGRGVELEDSAGKTYIDMYNNVPCVGHAHPHVVNAMHEQASTLNVHSRYLHEGIVRLADRLTELHNDAIESVVFACSGTEANDIAMTMARVATGGSGFICTNAAYHGNSQQVSQLTYVPVAQTKNPNICAFPFPEKFRAISDGDDQAIEAAYLHTIDNAIASFQAANIKLAGLLVCPIFANEGLPQIPAHFMAKAADRVRRAGGLVISDEVQAGYCRTGKWWGYEVSGFQPDIVVTGKPMGNGLPLSACAASQDLVNDYRAKTRYFNTFASSPLQAATGNAVLDVIEEEQLAANAQKVGAYLRSELESLVATNPHFAEVRGHGLFLGLEWVKDEDNQEPDREGAIQMVNALKDKGFLTSNAGAFNNIIKIRPPLVFAQKHADQFLQVFAECL